MIHKIVVYLQPWEIDDFDRQVDQLIKSKIFCNSIGYRYVNTKLDVTLNLNIVNWSNSSIPAKYFIDKFKYISTKASLHFDVNFDFDENIHGSLDKRRATTSNIDYDYITWLDSDLFFSTSLLSSLYSSLNVLNNHELNKLVVTPELIRYWDNSWDCLTNSLFINYPHTMRDTFDMNSLDYLELGDPYLEELSVSKFGGGWFTTFSKYVFKEYGLPVDLGSYGPDDLFMMILSQNDEDFRQFVIRNEVVTEIGKLYLNNKEYIKSLLDVNISDKHKVTGDEFNNIVKKYLTANLNG